VERDLARLGAALLVETLDAMAGGTVVETPQDDGLATYAHKLTREDGLVDWTRPAEHIHNLIRGLYPWPHAFSFLEGQRFILRRSHVSSAPSSLAPGTIEEAAGDRLAVATGAGLLEATEIQAEGKRPMAVREFLAGHRLVSGQRFGAP
jgi:methionyl-tRNA formyltransferase